jgi:hypothetical protein
MSSSKTTDPDGRYGEVCGATNNRGEPCKLPAGWGTPGSGGGRCKFHGGLSTGPGDTSHLEENDFAEGNPGGGAPEGNTNSRIHGGFSDWRKAYERFDDDMKTYVEGRVTDLAERAEPHTPDLTPERRERLAREYVVLWKLIDWVMFDVWAGIGENAAEDARGVILKEDVEIGGETHTVDKPNPALGRDRTLRTRRRKIRGELRLDEVYRTD